MSNPTKELFELHWKVIKELNNKHNLLCEEVIKIHKYIEQLYPYLESIGARVAELEKEKKNEKAG